MIKNKKRIKDIRQGRKHDEEAELKEIEMRLTEECPPKGSNPLSEDFNSNSERTPENYFPSSKLFSQLPISSRTKGGLNIAKYHNMTDIQRASIPHALVGRDILGSAMTGSGKTLAFLIPVLEHLYRNHWSKNDGLGALILSPTRELALQIFDVLRNIGSKHHSISAGLVIGGKDVNEERQRIGGMNIIIGTPGRVLHHMDESPNFNCDSLQLLVLDEADRILDMGFERELNSILSNLPKNRQTLLFSATQTKSVQQLARLSLKEPEFLSVHEDSVTSTPERLEQNYLVCQIQDKLDILWSFIKTHLRKKIIIFFSSQKQVRFVFNAFRLMRPGIPLMHIHGKMNQTKRMGQYYDFTKRPFACMLATDIAARGLDFKNIHWVIQYDCPESPETYIHRVGRTARYSSNGKGTLFLLESETKFVEKLENSKIPIKKTSVNKDRLQSIQASIQALLIQHPDMKFLAQKSLRSYLKSVYLMSDKETFKAEEIDVEAFAKSLGLLQIPKIKFLNMKKVDKNLLIQKEKQRMISEKIDQLKSDGDNDLLEALKFKKKTPLTQIERMMKKKNNDVLSDTYLKLRDVEDDDDDILVPKKGSSNDVNDNNDFDLNFEPNIQKNKKVSNKIKPYRTGTGEGFIRFEYDDDKEEKEKNNKGADMPFLEKVFHDVQSMDHQDKKDYYKRIKERKTNRKRKMSEENDIENVEGRSIKKKKI